MKVKNTESKMVQEQKHPEAARGSEGQASSSPCMQMTHRSIMQSVLMSMLLVELVWPDLGPIYFREHNRFPEV